MSSVADQKQSILKLGGVVSILQCVLFEVIALSALGLGVDNLITKGFGNLYQDSPWFFLLLCGAFILIAILGVAITPAERELLKKANNGLATLGSNLAYFGHMGTIAFFSWWIIHVTTNQNQVSAGVADILFSLKWGVMFELLFVGLWVWIFAYAVFRYGILSKSFGFVSIAKALSFWFLFIAIIMNEKIMLLCGVTLVAVIFGPWWHAWIAVKYLLRHDKE
ncbi:MAG TPA: hypothetical protein DDY17_11355 [Syntrophaceae bacterium]|jgi:hypothetical protein|nr:hypothetical protein [Syntrophaceae bacterium]